jgi:TetR/AcrR family transcriptional regulator, mexCD-oprJ operon repressor
MSNYPYGILRGGSTRERGIVVRATKRDRTTAALLEAAAGVFAEQGASARLADVAEAADVGLATLYRYFPNREALLEALMEYALDETSERLTAADLETVPFAEGVARVCRALVASRSKYALLARMVDHVDKGKAEPRLGGPIRALLRKGITEGTVRQDLSEDEMVIILGALVQAASYLVSQGQAGTERAATIASSVFLNGTSHPVTEG